MSKLIDFIKKQWDSDGECRSCGWHASLSEYDISENLTIDMDKGEIRLPCRSKDENGSGHRGVKIYFNFSTEG